MRSATLDNAGAASSQKRNPTLSMQVSDEITIDGSLQLVWEQRGWNGFSRTGQQYILHCLILLLLVPTALGGAVAFAVEVFRGTAALVFFVLLAVSACLAIFGMCITVAAWVGWFTPRLSPYVYNDPDERYPKVRVASLFFLWLDTGLLIAAILVAIINAALSG